MHEIVIIDDGVSPSFFGIGSLRHDCMINRSLKVKKRTNEKEMITHGTYCAGVIRKYAPDAVLSSLTILDESGRGNPAKLVRALKWCMEKKIRLVNLSLGSVDAGDVRILKKITRKATLKGMIIISALSNDHQRTYPASFPFVLGVQCQSLVAQGSGIPELTGDSFFFHPPSTIGADVTACGEHLLFGTPSQKIMTPNSNSIAAALITAKIHGLLLHQPNMTVRSLKESMI